MGGAFLRLLRASDLMYCSSSPVPGGSDGPSGVLVCCENYLVYKNFGDQSDLRCPIPRRKVCGGGGGGEEGEKGKRRVATVCFSHLSMTWTMLIGACCLCAVLHTRPRWVGGSCQ